MEVYLWNDTLAIGLGRATRHDQVALSFATAPGWDQHEIKLERQWIEDTLAGPMDRTDDAVVRHASQPKHIDALADHIREMSLPYGFSGSDLWAQREMLFPGVGFLPRVEGDLATLVSGAPELSQLRVRLRQLAQAARDWHRDGGAAPQWLSHVTPEGMQRKKLCMFQDLDGVTRCFDLHARFTPGHGRIHMRLNRAAVQPYLTIAYVGHKLK